MKRSYSKIACSINKSEGIFSLYFPSIGRYFKILPVKSLFCVNILLKSCTLISLIFNANFKVVLRHCSLPILQSPCRNLYTPMFEVIGNSEEVKGIFVGIADKFNGFVL